MPTPCGLSDPRPLAILCLTLVFGACGGGDVILPDDGDPTAIAILKGDKQRGRVGEPLTDSLEVQVSDAKGRAVRGVTVAFEFGTAGAGASVIPQEKTTNSDGVAKAKLVLGTSIGQQTGRARVVTQEGREPVQTSFSATADPENANGMAAVAGEDQTGHVGQPLDDRLVVEVTDGFGNPVAGVPIHWAVGGGGSVSAEIVETDEDGRSRVERILGPAVGQQTTIATADLAGSPVIFTHIAVAGNASRLTVVSGNDQTAEAGTQLPAELVVRLVDSEGNGVPSTAVTWVVATGGGTAGPQNTITDGEGRTSTQWTLGEALGEQRLDAVVSGVGVAAFRATATAGAPASLLIRTQPSATARNGIRLDRQPVIQLRDSRGNDVAAAGVEVTVQLQGGGELLGTTRRDTDGSGRATFDDLAISGGPGPRTLSFTASGYAPVTSNEIQLQAIGTSTTITGDSPDPSGVGATFTVSFRVTSEGPTPTGSVTVSDGTQTCTGPLSDGEGSCPLALSTPGQRTLTATYNGGPGLNSSSDTEPHTVAASTPDNDEPFADFNWNCVDLTCSFRDNSRDDGTITSRVWELGDGTTIRDQLEFNHTYATAGNYRVVLTVTDNGGLSDQSEDIVSANAPPPQTLRIREQPSSSTTIGEEFRTQPEIELRVGDDRLERSGVTVLVSIASGSGSLGGTTTATTDEDGRARFSNLSIGGATGSHTLRFTAGGFGEVISNTIEVQKASSEIRITSFDPDEPIVGQTVRVGFTVDGAGGPPTGNVTVTADDPGESCTGTVADGFCNIVFAAPGDRDLTATYGGDGRFEADSDSEDIEVDPAPPVNQPPTAADDATSTDAGAAVTIPVRDNDTDPEGATLSIAGIGTPANGTAVENGGSITYTPNAGYSGSDSFTYSVSDGALTSNVATVSVTVNPAPLPPPAELGITTPPSDEARSGVPFDTQPIIQLRDGSGVSLAIPGVQVTAQVASGGGTLLGNDSITDGSGQAAFTTLAIDGEGDHRLEFTAAGYTSVRSDEIDVQEDD